MRMRSPMIVCRRMKAHSSGVEGQGLFRITSGMAILPMSCSSAARATSSRSSGLMSSSRDTAMARPATSLQMVVKVGLALRERAQQDVAGLAAGRRCGDRPCGRTCACRRAEGRPRRSSASSRQQRPRRASAVISNPSPLSLSARQGGGHDGSAPAAPGAGEHAELVAAEAVGAAEAARRRPRGARPGGRGDRRRPGGRRRRCSP